MLKFQKTRSNKLTVHPSGGLQDELKSRLVAVRKQFSQKSESIKLSDSKDEESNQKAAAESGLNESEANVNQIHRFDPKQLEPDEPLDDKETSQMTITNDDHDNERDPNRSSLLKEKKKDYHSLKANGENGVYKFDPQSVNTNGYHHVQMNGSENENVERDGLGSKRGSTKSNVEYELDPNETFTSKAKKALENYKNTRSSNSSNSDFHDELTMKKKFSKSKHAPLPFKNETKDEPKLIQ